LSSPYDSNFFPITAGREAFLERLALPKQGNGYIADVHLQMTTIKADLGKGRESFQTGRVRFDEYRIGIWRITEI